MQTPLLHITRQYSKHSFSVRITATLLLSLLVSLPATAETVVVPADILQQLTALTQRVQQLEKQVAQQQVALQQSQQHQQQPTIATTDHVSDLEQRMLVMERKQQLMAYDAAEQKKHAPVILAGGDKGFGLQSADGAFEMRLRGLIQADARSFDSTDSINDNFLMRRVRPTIEGKFNDTYGFKLTTDFGNGISGSSHLVDAYVDADFDPAYKVRIGKFTPGLSLYRLQSSGDTKLNELGLSSNFLPSRDQGVQLSGDLFNKRLNYSIGLFNGANDGANGSEDSNTDKEINARLFASPFADTSGAFKHLGFGVGISTTDASGKTGATSLSGYKTFGQETFFSYRRDTSSSNTVFADGERTRLVPQFSYYYGPFGLTGEYVFEEQEVTRVFGTSPNDQRTKGLDSSGWDITASYVLTGEKAAGGKNIKPAKPFDPARGNWGAWEVVAGVGQMDLDKKIFLDSNGTLTGNDNFAQATSAAKQAQNYAVGLNWYLNNILRISLDYSDTNFKWGGGGTTNAPDDRDNERVLMGRVQASF